jgi:hypothetical protein
MILKILRSKKNHKCYQSQKLLNKIKYQVSISQLKKTLQIIKMMIKKRRRSYMLMIRFLNNHLNNYLRIIKINEKSKMHLN